MRCHVACTVRLMGLQEQFEFGERLLNGIVVGAVRRQEEEPDSSGANRRADGSPNCP